jgi:hypothetical protein
VGQDVTAARNGWLSWAARRPGTAVVTAARNVETLMLLVELAEWTRDGRMAADRTPTAGHRDEPQDPVTE